MDESGQIVANCTFIPGQTPPNQGGQIGTNHTDKAGQSFLSPARYRPAIGSALTPGLPDFLSEMGAARGWRGVDHLDRCRRLHRVRFALHAQNRRDPLAQSTSARIHGGIELTCANAEAVPLHHRCDSCIATPARPSEIPSAAILFVAVHVVNFDVSR